MKHTMQWQRLNFQEGGGEVMSVNPELKDGVAGYGKMKGG